MSAVLVTSLFTTNNSNGSPVVENPTADVVAPISNVETSENADVELLNTTSTVPNLLAILFLRKEIKKLDSEYVIRG